MANNLKQSGKPQSQVMSSLMATKITLTYLSLMNLAFFLATRKSKSKMQS